MIGIIGDIDDRNNDRNNSSKSFSKMLRSYSFICCCRSSRRDKAFASLSEPFLYKIVNIGLLVSELIAR